MATKRNWRTTIVTPRLGVSCGPDGNAEYHELLEDHTGCKAGQVNTFTYSKQKPNGRAGRIPQHQLIGLLDENQFSVAAQWQWPDLDMLPSLIFGDPNWLIDPVPEAPGDYAILYEPHPCTFPHFIEGIDRQF